MVAGVQIGTVSFVARYPVKSMAGEELAAVKVSRRGLEGDREWAVYTEDGGIGSGKTTRRFRQVDGLLAHRSELGGAPVPWVTFPSGAVLGAADPAIDEALARSLDRAVALRRESDVPHHDESAVHLVTTASMRAVRGLLGEAVDVRRLRANLVLDVAGGDFVEDAWIGRELRIGGVVLGIGDGMVRCRMVDAAQAGVRAGAPMLRTLGAVHDVMLGVQATVRSPGTIRLGDPAHLL